MQSNPLCEANSDGIKVFDMGSQTFASGMNQIVINTSDIAYNDIILSFYTNYPSGGVRYLHPTFSKSSGNWILSVNNLSGASQTANAYIVYKKMA